MEDGCDEFNSRSGNGIGGRKVESEREGHIGVISVVITVQSGVPGEEVVGGREGGDRRDRVCDQGHEFCLKAFGNLGIGGHC